jgi:hypothetical protein
MVRVLFGMQRQPPSRSSPVCHWMMETTHTKHTGSVAYIDTTQIRRHGRPIISNRPVEVRATLGLKDTVINNSFWLHDFLHWFALICRNFGGVSHRPCSHPSVSPAHRAIAKAHIY